METHGEPTVGGWHKKPEVGQVFGRWTVLEIGLRTCGGKMAAAKVRCACGVEQIIQLGSLRYSVSKGCRKCSKLEKRVVNPGDRFGLWLVIDRQPGTYCLCRCECGLERRIRCGHLRDGLSRMCRGCFKRIGGKGGLRTYWSAIVAGAKKRGLEVTVDMDFMLGLLSRQKSKCALTGLRILLPTSSSDFDNRRCTASIDRIDSAKGYTPENVQWVHKVVNVMKMDLDEGEFFRLCRLVADSHPDVAVDRDSPVSGHKKRGKKSSE